MNSDTSNSERTDVIIVGGGLAGLGAAHAALKRGLACTVIEARDDVGLETSFANGGLLTPSMADPWNAPGVGAHLAASLVRSLAPVQVRFTALPTLIAWGLRFLANASPAAYRRATDASFHLATLSLTSMQELISTRGRAFDAARRGTLKVFQDPAAFAAMTEIAHRLAKSGLEVRTVDSAAIARIEPHLAEAAPSLAGGLFYPDDVSGDSRKFCLLLAQEIIRLGGCIRLSEPVSALVREAGRVVGVTTPNGELRAPRVVISAGARSLGLTKPLGVRPAIRPAKGYSITYQIEPSARGLSLPLVDDARHIALTPLGDRLRVVGYAEFANFDRSLRPERLAGLRAMIKELCPRLEAGLGSQTGSAWAGFRPMSADGLPYIGETKVPGLWLNAGHGHLGFTLSAGSGELLANLMLGESPAIDPAPYSARRP